MKDKARKIYRRTAEQLREIAPGEQHEKLLFKAAYMIDHLTTLLDQAEMDMSHDLAALARDIVAQAKRDQA